ncbi:hypothetical protein [Gracilibacillus boraciitolerans]|nr:hypothetical protein [Gracilibacillus boraciitolerans]
MIKTRKAQIITCICMMIVLLLLLLSQRPVEEMIKYFPLDESISFDSATTELRLLHETGNDQYLIKWTSKSTLHDVIYLRQDVSLLYMDGRLKGMKGLWKEQEKDIKLELTFEESDSSHFQALSFHHGGEAHYPNDEIKSIQQMSSDHLYVIDSPYSALESFREPSSSSQEEWRETIEKTTNQQLQFTWKEWLTASNIQADDYILIPFIDIVQFQEQPISQLSQEQTDKIIGQLWEGIYKEYILPISNQTKTKNQMMPLILIDKDLDHLIVLFSNEQNQLETLYQKISLSH